MRQYKRLLKRIIFNSLFLFSCPYKNDPIHIPGGGWDKNKKSPAAFLGVEFVSGVINDPLHNAFLSDGILPLLLKIEKILSDKKQYVAVHQSMPAPLFELQRNRVGGQ